MAALRSRAGGALLVFVLLVLWEASARSGLVRSANWPPFTQVLAALAHGIADGEMLPEIGSSLWRMAQGYALGATVGFAVGLALALIRPLRITLEPALELVRPIPITALVPPLIFLLGLDDPLKIFCVALATFFPVALNTMAGVAGVDRVYLQVAQTFGIPRWVTLRRVVVPAAMPLILAGLRTSLAIALVVTVISEMLAGHQGVGYYLMSMEFAMRAADMYAVIVVLTLTAYLLNRGFLACEARIIHWARTRELSGSTP